MILDIDIGNTRLKWRLSEKGKIKTVGSEQGLLHEMLVDLACRVSSEKISRVRIAHVLGVDREVEVKIFFYKNIDIVVEFARSNECCAGVVNQYQLPEQLGVDRWLAVLAAFNFAKTACCVIDCGSAITVDFVLSDGAYVGGYIAPGISLLTSSLHENTKLLPAILQHTIKKISYGKSTADAMRGGTLMMAVSFIEKSVQHFMESNKVITVYLTGGDAELVASHISLPSVGQITMMPNLVLDGLSIALP